MKFLYLFSLALLIISACVSKHDTLNNEIKLPEIDSVDSEIPHNKPISSKNEKFFTVNNKQYLYGGKNSNQHYDITNSILKNEQFHYGIRREEFPILLEPEFSTIEKADEFRHDTSRFLLAHSVEDLTPHEVVNDMLNGEPIMATYCVLADLGAIYTGTNGNKVLTFGLSGYTYHDDVWDGVDVFIFWDRETESLWWPLIGKAVSGPLNGVGLKEVDKAYWQDTDRKTIKEQYPTAMILNSSQDYDRPKTWRKYDHVADIVENFTLED